MAVAETDARTSAAAASLAARPGMPPGPQLPRPVALGLFLTRPAPMLRTLQRRHGDMFSVELPVFGRSVIVAGPALVRRVFQARSDELAFGERSPLGTVLGPGSLFAMDGERHLRERRLILPAFHGERMRRYAPIIEAEAAREMATWPERHEFASQPSFMAITLRAILRTVFGAEGAEVAELGEILPPYVTIASRLTLLPALQRDLGPRSPGGRMRRLRARYDAVVDRLIDARRADPQIDGRDDVLSLLVGAHYEDGSGVSRRAIADELLTLLAAGHETTATSLAWAVDRLRRHPVLLRRLTVEARAGDDNALRIATILEVQRSRPVIAATSRYTLGDFELGGRVIPGGRQIVVSATLIHSDPRFFPDPGRFDPERFLRRAPDTYTWVPFGGGTRRCPGAAFAHMEMDIVLRTLLRAFDLAPTAERSERVHDRGIANAPARGGRAAVQRVR